MGRFRRFAPAFLTRRTPAERRWLYARAALVPLALVVLVVLPAYLAQRPVFMERYPAFERPYTTWSGSLHSDVACQQCHVPPAFGARTGYIARMFSEFYISLVSPGREPALFAPPTNDACNRCHMEDRTVSTSGDLLIPHRAHVEMLEMECVECHDFVLHESTPDEPHTPPMSGCLTCHDGQTAKADCAACHTDKDPPDTHFEADWLEVHHLAAADDGCTTCHEWTEHWCEDCHSIRPDSHVEEWRALHRDVVAARQPRNCEACHAEEFCVRCHAFRPPLNLSPRAGRETR